jgi:hypothetical protein
MRTSATPPPPSFAPTATSPPPCGAVPHQRVTFDVERQRALVDWLDQACAPFVRNATADDTSRLSEG